MSLLRKIIYAVLLVLLGLCVWPAYLVWWAERVVAKNGCEFGIAMHQNGCWVDGVNIASDINSAYSYAGVVILTMPIGFAIVVTLLVMISKDVKRRAAQEADQA